MQPRDALVHALDGVEWGYWEDRLYHAPEDNGDLADAILAALPDGWVLTGSDHHLIACPTCSGQGGLEAPEADDPCPDCGGHGLVCNLSSAAATGHPFGLGLAALMAWDRSRAATTEVPDAAA